MGPSAPAFGALVNQAVSWLPSTRYLYCVSGWRPWITTRWSVTACPASVASRSEEHTSELQSRLHLVCRLLLEKKKNNRRAKVGLVPGASDDYARVVPLSLL